MNDFSPRPFGLVFDLETTAREPHEARIVTAYLGLMDTDGEILQQKDYIVAPGVPIPAETTAIHGITDEYAAEHGQAPAIAVGDILSLIQLECANNGLPLVGHNVSYDCTVLLEEARRHLSAESAKAAEDLLRSINVLDSHVIDKQVDRFRKGKRTLVATAAHYGVELSEEDAHGASADAVASGRIVLAIMRKYPHVSTLTSPPNINYAELHESQIVWRAEQAASLQVYLRKADPVAYVNPGWPIQIEPAKELAA